MKAKRTQEETLHIALDMVTARFIRATGKIIAKTPILDLIMWSGQQMLDSKAKAKRRRK